MNRSIFFSMYSLWVTKKMNHFLRNLVLGENISLFQYRSNSFFQRERFLVKNRQVLFSVVLLWPLIGMQNPSHPILTHILRADLREFLFHSHRLIWSMKNSDPRVTIVCAQRHNSDIISMLTAKITVCNFQYGPNFGVSLDPAFRLWCCFFSWKSAFTTGHCIKLWEISEVFCHEILSILNNTQKSCIHTEFTPSILLRQLLNSFFILLQ